MTKMQSSSLPCYRGAKLLEDNVEKIKHLHKNRNLGLTVREITLQKTETK